MSQSYIPHGTKIVCTNMTNSTPQTLVVHRGKKTVMHTKPFLLTNEDKKISDTFVCKNTSKFWGGLTTMCAGIALGALAVLAVAAATAAEVATGGLATPVILALVGVGAATLATVGSATMLAIKGHDCDYTLESEWLHYHTRVHFDGANAILHNSLLKCSKGGMISIFLDDTLAQEAATEISKNNNEEVNQHETSQFFEGLITGVTSLTGLGVCVGLTFSVWDYTGDENEMEKGQGEFTEKSFEDAKNKKEFETPGLGEAEADRANKFVKRDIPAGPAGDLALTAKTEGKEGVEEYFTKASFKGVENEPFGKGWKGSINGLIAGAVGAAVSTWIDNNSNLKENDLFNDVIEESLVLRNRENKKKSGINVSANES